MANTIANCEDIVMISHGPPELRAWLDTLKLLPKRRESYEKSVELLLTRLSRGDTDVVTLNREMDQLMGTALFARLAPFLATPRVSDPYKYIYAANMFIKMHFDERDIAVEIITSFRDWKNRAVESSFLNPVTKRLESGTYSLERARTIYFTFRPDGSLDVSLSRTIELFTTPIRISKKKVIPFPVERVRQCPSCKDVYWASRTDAGTCGKKTCREKQSKSKNKKDGKKYGDL